MLVGKDASLLSKIPHVCISPLALMAVKEV
jgi:hypothetical protein